ncbi:MAG: Crp/Fnr family transcriptional regulator [Polyangiales bacterium]
MNPARTTRRRSLPILPDEVTTADAARCPIGLAAGCADGAPCPLTPHAFAAGTALGAEGAPADRVWYLRRGSVALYRDAGPEGGEFPWVIRKAGALVGEEALVQDDFSDTAVALTAGAACVGRRDELRAWIDRGGDAARTVLSLVIRARVEAAPRPSTPDGSAPRRVARWLADEARGGCAPPLPRHVLAGLLGMKPETLSRALAALARAGAVRVTRREVRVVDAARLLAAADGPAPRALTTDPANR